MQFGDGAGEGDVEEVFKDFLFFLDEALIHVYGLNVSILLVIILLSIS